MRKLEVTRDEIPGFGSFRYGRYLLATLLIVLINSLPQFVGQSAYGQGGFETDDSEPGYLDSAFVGSRVRLRFDAGWGLNRPDRAEFFYASWANLADHQHAIKDTNQLLTAVNDRGPFLIPESINFQEISTYLEVAFNNDRWSLFTELPIRFVQFKGDIEDPAAFTTPSFRAQYDLSPTETQGVSDLQVGFKYGMLNDPNVVLTFQLRTFIPTGDSRDGLGTGHVSIEPALLTQMRLTENVSFMGQAKLWTSIDGGTNAGNIAIYGAGLGYDLFPGGGCSNGLRITPLIEFVGWTVLDGFETLSSPTSAEVVPNTAQVIGNPNDINDLDPPQNQVSGVLDAPTSHGVQIATSQTIINAKLGARAHFNQQDSVYIGWGRALSGAIWYQDFARIEFRRLY